MSLDLFQQEANDRLTAMPPVQNVDPGMFDGFVRGTGLATMKGFAKAGRAIDLLGSLGPMLQDTFTSGTEAQDKYFKEHDAVFGRAVDYWTPRSTEIGSAAEVMGTLLSVIPHVIASPSLAVATTQLGTAEDLANVGVTSGKANIVGAIQGAGLGVGIWMPILGQNLWQRALIGGAGFNMVQGVATRAASGVILNDTPAKDMFKAFDGEAMTLDALLGLAFGSMAHLSPQQRAQGKEVWGRIQTWAENLSPEQKAAISTLREGEHLNVDSTPGRPVQAADIQAHVERMRTAIDQLATDQPVAVEDITVPRRVPEEVGQIQQLREELQTANTSREAALEAGDQATATRWNGEIERLNRELTDKSTIVAEDAKKPAEQQPRFEPDPERIKEAEATMQTLVDQAQVVRAEEGLPPPPEEAPRVTQSVRRTIEEALARAGRPTEEAAAGAALWDAFYTTMAKRIGMTAAQLWERFPLARITNERPGDAALSQASRRDRSDIGYHSEQIEKYAESLGWKVDNSHGSSLSGSRYLELSRPTKFKDGDPVEWENVKIRISDHELPPSYKMQHGEADYEVTPVGGDHMDANGSWENAIAWLARKAEKPTPAPVQAILSKARNAAELQAEIKAGAERAALRDGLARFERASALLETGGYQVRRSGGGKGKIYYFSDEGGPLFQVTKDYTPPAEAPYRGDYSRLNVWLGVKPDSNGPILHAAVEVPGNVTDRGAIFKAAHEALRPEVQRATAPENTLWQDQRRDTWYTSALGEGIAKLNMKAAPAKGWLDALKGLGSKGVKADEVKWSGLEEWLQMQEGRITKEQVQEFLTNNGVKVEEVMLGEPDKPVWQDWARAMRERGVSATEAETIARRAVSNDETGINEAYQYGVTDADVRGGLARADDTKFGQYQLPGGQNYRELLLTLPDRTATTLPDGYSLKQSGERWSLVDASGVGEFLVLRNDANKEQATTEALDLLRRRGVREGRGAFTSSHFDTPNILAHIRFNERTDAERKKVLFIEEFQSDWAQQGKRKGFADGSGIVGYKWDGAAQDWVRAPDDQAEQWGAAQLDGNQDALWESRAIAEQKLNRARIPAAPFVGKTDAWVGLALKRMIAYAAENGFDRVAWTRGEQQVERYTGALRQAVDTIEWNKTKDGIQLVGYKGRQGFERLSYSQGEYVRLIELDDIAHSDRDLTPVERAEYDALKARSRTKVVDTTEREDALSDAIGKAMAEKIISDPNQTGTIEGDGIRIDSTGMAGFYDKIVPKVANEVLKKLGGGKVEETTIEVPTKETGTASIDIPDGAPTFRKMHDSEIDGLAGMDDFANGSRPGLMEATIVVNGVEQDVLIAVDPNGVHLINDQFEAAIDLPTGKDQTYSEAVGWVEQAWSTPGFWNAFELINGKFPGVVKAGSAQQSFDITPAMKAKVEGGLPLFQKTKGTERGYMSMGEEGRVIGLLEGADASTFVHESGHFFLDTMAEIGRLPDVPAAVRADLDTALAWMGVKDPGKWAEMSLDEKRPYHEKFARGFEQYLRDGEAPSAELKGVFQRFRDWLVELYKSAKSLNVKLNDDIRGVLNRMLADQVSNPSTEAPLAPAARAVPPPPLGEGGEAPAGAEVRLIDQPAIRDTLQRMADDEVGWAQIGGRLLDQSQLGSGKPSFSTWIPKAEWWRDRPDKKMNGPQAQTAVRKALADENLKPIEQRIVDHMLEMADERLRGVDRVGGEEEYQALGIDAWDEGLEPSTVNLVDLDLAARAAAIDEAYVERAAIKYENDDAAFRGELEMLIYEHEAKQAAEIAGRRKAGEQPAPGEKPAAGKKAGPADLVRNEADLIVEKNPEMPITVGINPDGTPMTMSAREFLETARAEADLNRQDVKLLEVAAQCLLGVF